MAAHDTHSLRFGDNIAVELDGPVISLPFAGRRGTSVRQRLEEEEEAKLRQLRARIERTREIKAARAQTQRVTDLLRMRENGLVAVGGGGTFMTDFVELSEPSAEELQLQRFVDAKRRIAQLKDEKERLRKQSRDAQQRRLDAIRAEAARVEEESRRVLVLKEMERQESLIRMRSRRIADTLARKQKVRNLSSLFLTGGGRCWTRAKRRRRRRRRCGTPFLRKLSSR
jgi:hypothetical protein